MTFPILPSNAAVTGFPLRSLRFNSADGAYLNRTFTTPTSSTVWTLSLWIKRGLLTGTYRLFGASTTTYLTFNSSDQLNLTLNGTSAATSTAVFRDPSAWYHIVYQQNGAAQTIYVNNSSVATGTTAASVFNTAIVHQLGSANTSNYFNGYMTEVNFIDGQALTPSSFGETNGTTGQWQPKRYTGTYGTNGFYLNFSDNSGTTATTLGKDYSGNGNNWTPNNFSVTAGAGNDSLVDVPTPYGTDTGAGGQVRGNYCTLNPLDKNSNIALANGNLDVSLVTTTNLWYGVRGTFGVSTGKWYFEATLTAANYVGIGFFNFSTPLDGGYNDIFSTTSGAVLGLAFDIDAGTLTKYLNGVSQGTASKTASDLYAPMVQVYGTGACSVNFGQRPFAYTAPSGYKALCTTNLPTPTIGASASTLANQYFTAVLYTGDGTSNRFISAGMTPHFMWVKNRSNVSYATIIDSVRGTGKYLYSLLSSQENVGGDVMPNSGPTTNGFVVDNPANELNSFNATFVAWLWKANGAGVTNTAGSITSTVSANTTSGFSIVTYTGTGANATVGHGLGVAPRMVIVKSRTQGTTGYTGNWAVWHTSIANTEYLLLNTTDTKAAGATYWNSATPTSSVFSIGTAGLVNTNTHNFVAYCFAEIAGYSKFGSYTGNGSADGPFVYCGFRPAYVLIKMSSSTGNWVTLDAKRLGYNVDNNPLYTNQINVEGTTDLLDITSNGFKIRSTDASVNTSSGTYIFAAFAENPFKYSLAR